MTDMRRRRNLVRTTVTTGLIASLGMAGYWFLTEADAILVAIALFLALLLAMTLLVDVVLGRNDRTREPGYEENRLAAFWRLPPR